MTTKGELREALDEALFHLVRSPEQRQTTIDFMLRQSRVAALITEPEPRRRRAPAETVNCDDSCGALVEPRTAAEVRAAFEHWRDHYNAFGCSHGN